MFVNEVDVFLESVRFQSSSLLFAQGKADRENRGLTSQAYCNKPVEGLRPNTFWVWLTCLKKQTELLCFWLLRLRLIDHWHSASFKDDLWMLLEAWALYRAGPCGLHPTSEALPVTASIQLHKWEPFSLKLSSRQKKVYLCSICRFPSENPIYLSGVNGPSSTVRLHISGASNYSSCSKDRHLHDLNKNFPHRLPYLNTYSGLLMPSGEVSEE